MKLVSLVFPVYNEEDALPHLRRQLIPLLDSLAGTYAFEIVLVDDGSSDNSWPEIVAWSKSEPRLRGFSFSRNFGHQAALSCGYDLARGHAIITMDADLQDPPEVIPEMLKLWETGVDIVYAVRSVRRGETFLKLWTAKWFYRIFARVSETRSPLDAGDFRLMSKRAARALSQMGERHRYLRGMVGWIGFRSGIVRYERPGRVAGVTKFNLRKMLRFAADGIISSSSLPLRLFYLGGLICALPFLAYLAYSFILHIWYGKELVAGWTSLLLSIISFGTLQLISLGIMGEYIGRIYEEGKRRPLFIIAEETDQKSVNLPP